MADFVIKILRQSFLFGRNVAGCLNNPYITFRKIALEKNNFWPTAFITLFSLAYFEFAGIIRAGLGNPIFLTSKFNSLVLTSSICFIGCISLFYLLGKIMKKTGSFRTLTVLWSYSLLPTLIWFFTTSCLYLILPPPRTMSILGKIYSVFYIAFSIALLYWKIILYYLTLRFGLKMEIGKIMLVSVVFVAYLGLFALITYRLGVFRIPFI